IGVAGAARFMNLLGSTKFKKRLLYLRHRTNLNHRQHVKEESEHVQQLSELYKSTLATLAFTIDAKDRSTHGHIVRVQAYVRSIVQAMDLGRAESEGIVAAALLHDI